MGPRRPVQPAQEAHLAGGGLLATKTDSNTWAEQSFQDQAVDPREGSWLRWLRAFSVKGRMFGQLHHFGHQAFLNQLWSSDESNAASGLAE